MTLKISSFVNDRYEITDLIHEGAFGLLYSVKDLVESNQTYSIIILFYYIHHTFI